jgi:hypothetical protein
MKHVAMVLVGGLTFALSGCGTSYSLKEFAPTTSGPKSAFIDIKQRAVLSSMRDDNKQLVMCAEPSPDAMSSFVTELALDARYKEAVAATLALSQQEAASFVGLRTQTIQLLRDGMYRLCEGYMSGALTAADYSWLSRRYQRNMVALLTIEQLTRVAQVPAIAHASQGLASASRSATAIQGDLAELNRTRTKLEEEKTKLEADLTTAQALADTDNEKKGKVEAATKLIKEKQAAIAEVDELKAALLEGLKTAKGLLASGSTTVQVLSAGVVDGQASRNNEIAKAISSLTEKVLDQDDLPTLCFQLITGARSGAKADEALTRLMASCSGLVEKKVQIETAAAGNVANQPGRPPVFLAKPLQPGVFLDLDELFSDQGVRSIEVPAVKREQPKSDSRRPAGK